MKSNRKKEAIFQPVAAPIYTLEDEITDDSLFEPLDDAEKQTDVISRPSLTYWQNAWQKLRRDPLAMAGIVVIILMILLAILGRIIPRSTKRQMHSTGLVRINSGVTYLSAWLTVRAFR